jgi:hypothetical protein
MFRRAVPVIEIGIGPEHAVRPLGLGEVAGRDQHVDPGRHVLGSRALDEDGVGPLAALRLGLLEQPLQLVGHRLSPLGLHKSKRPAAVFRRPGAFSALCTLCHTAGGGREQEYFLPAFGE